MAKTLTNTKNQKTTILTGARAYGELRQAVTKAGILERDYSYYIFMTLFAYSGFFMSGYYIYTVSSWPFLAFWSVVFAFFTVQVAGLLHDAGHRAIFKSSILNDIYGTICSSLIAMVHENWRVRHNKHHAHTNEETVDPDITIPLLSFTQERFRSKSGWAKVLRPYQVFFYFPIGILIDIALRIDPIAFYKNNFKWYLTPLIAIYVLGLFVWFVGPFIFFPFWKALFVVLLVHLSTGLYAWNIFAPNHKGNPHIAKGVKFSFLEHQVMTSRNIYGHPITDIMYMGLNYQIEHHLFPNCPRGKLKLISPYLMAVCKKLKLDYERVTVLESNKIILNELMVVAKAG